MGETRDAQMAISQQTNEKQVILPRLEFLFYVNLVLIVCNLE